jgi:hypothetical protein
MPLLPLLLLLPLLRPLFVLLLPLKGSNDERAASTP